jgi:hypothetical protein
MENDPSIAVSPSAVTVLSPAFKRATFTNAKGFALSSCSFPVRLLLCALDKVVIQQSIIMMVEAKSFFILLRLKR